ncbi:hypothetical protein KDH_66880 [Dictyobacter sp. S3.2.2.5]|uniref:Anti-bacteriophage protein A/HamA C-terminal domain-containing protein n=1 Tax=Dictyobacter halimunensis TaxID=3026934 RepID=A0ABQ6G023_9CHLR|nr:hypothetical protein KDH_66880 [Dictyobacter sp. S3.2.2.5]
MITQNKFSPWLKNDVSKWSNDKKYRHRLITEHPNKRDDFLEELASYVHAAHEDARIYLREAFLENNLDPLEAPPSFDPTEGYPELLHIEALQGYFGEIFAGLIAEHFSPFDENSWKVPLFLFRYHIVAFQELERIHQTGTSAKKIPGRTGDDCLAFQLDSEGQIIRYLYCEAKCTTGGNKTNLVGNAHDSVSISVPVDIPRIIEVLKKREDAESKQWVLALQKLSLFLRKKLPENCNYEPERCDMVSYICSKSPASKTRTAWLSKSKPHEKYKAQRRLETVEIHLPAVRELIQKVYERKNIIKTEISIEYALKD